MGQDRVLLTSTTPFKSMQSPLKRRFLKQQKKKILKDTYVDNIQSGGDFPNELVTFKEKSTKIIGAGRLELHMLQSNVAELNSSMTIE